MSLYDACTFSNDTAVSNATVSGAEVFQSTAYPLPWYGNILVVIGYGVMFRLVAYLALRFLHQKKK